jgi:hypothetical protein
MSSTHLFIHVLALKTRGGFEEQLRCAAHIPVGVLRTEMAQVNGEMGQELLHLSSLAMPEGEPLHVFTANV